MNGKYLLDDNELGDNLRSNLGLTLGNCNFSNKDFSNERHDVNEDNLNNLDFKEKLMMSENTMPGFFISLMMANKQPMSETQLYDSVLPRMNDLRKPDGSKYKDNIKKVVKSTLCSSGIFDKVDSENKLWYYREEDAIHYINRTVEKTLSRKFEKTKGRIYEEDDIINIVEDSGNLNNNNNLNNLNNFSSSLNNNQLLNKKMKRSLRNYNFKFIKANNILNELLSRYKSNSELKRQLKNPFSNCDNAVDFIKRSHGDESKILGMLITYKFFRPLLNKTLKMLNLKHKPQKVDVNKLNVKMEDLENKLEMFQQMFAKIDPNDFRDKFEEEDKLVNES